MPKEMAVKAENVGVVKAGLGTYRMFALAILAGAFIGHGGELRHHRVGPVWERLL